MHELHNRVSHLFAAAIIGFSAILAGCGTVPRALVGKASASAPKDNGTPAKVEHSESNEVIEIPSGTEVYIRECASTLTTPAIRQIQFTLSGSSSYRMKREQAEATTGTIDTKVAMHRFEVKERAMRVYIAVAIAIAGLIVRSLLPAWPGLSNGLLAGAGLLGLSIYFTAINPYFAIVPPVLFGIMALVYWRAEWDKDKDGIPDFLQKKGGAS